LERSIEEEGYAAGAWSRPKSRGQINSATTIYKIATTGCRITKMPLLGLKFGSFA